MRTQAASDPFAKLYTFTTPFNGFQIRRFDPFCLVMTRSDRAIITISLQLSNRRTTYLRPDSGCSRLADARAGVNSVPKPHSPSGI